MFEPKEEWTDDKLISAAWGAASAHKGTPEGSLFAALASALDLYRISVPAAAKAWDEGADAGACIPLPPNPYREKS